MRTVRLLPDGTVDPAFHMPLGDSPPAIRELDDGSLLALQTFWNTDRWLANGSPDFNFDVAFTNSDGWDGGVFDALSGPTGALYVGGRFSDVNVVARSGLVRLVPVEIPGITVQPTDATVVSGRAASLHVAIGNFDPATYQWQRDGKDLSGATSPLLAIDIATAADAGTYRVIVHVGSATYVSDPAVLTINRSQGRLMNFSARSRVESGGLPQIAGFVVAGEQATQPALLRAIELHYGSGNSPKVVPRLGLFRGLNEIASDQGSARNPEILELSQRLGAFDPPIWQPIPFVFINPDSALAVNLANGIYTAQTTATAPGQGVSLFEFYDAADAAAPGIVRNASLRGRTAPGGDTMIGGFVIGGSGPLRLLLRVVGPELAHWGVPDPLANPQLTVYNRWARIVSNDDWEEQADGNLAPLLAATTSTGAFDLGPGSTSSALLVSLEPGAYTVHATGSNEASGEVLLEIYVVDP